MVKVTISLFVWLETSWHKKMQADRNLTQDLSSLISSCIAALIEAIDINS